MSSPRRKGTDHDSYVFPDSGCELATEALGGISSRCFSCPFDECLYNISSRNERRRQIDNVKLARV